MSRHFSIVLLAAGGWMRKHQSAYLSGRHIQCRTTEFSILGKGLTVCISHLVRVLTPTSASFTLVLSVNVDFYNYSPQGQTMNLREGSIFYSLEKNGLISFSDYILLLTMLSSKW